MVLQGSVQSLQMAHAPYPAAATTNVLKATCAALAQAVPSACRLTTVYVHATMLPAQAVTSASLASVAAWQEQSTYAVTGHPPTNAVRNIYLLVLGLLNDTY
jgi:hypothetical protein